MMFGSISSGSRRRGALAYFAVLVLGAVLTPSISLAQDDGVNRAAAAVVSYEYTRDKCFYEDVLGPFMARIDETVSRNIGSRWDLAKSNAELSIADLPRQLGPGLQPCEAYGFVIGDTLMFLTNSSSDPALLSAAARLVQHGGRPL